MSDVDELKEIKKFKFRGRQVLDDVVRNHHTMDDITFGNLKRSSEFGNIKVDSRVDKLSLDKGNLSEGKLIDDLVIAYNYLSFDGSDSYIDINGLKCDVDIEIIRFLKACLTSQICVCQEYSSSISKYVLYVISHIMEDGEVVLPMNVENAKSLDGVIISELNEFLESILKKNNIKYSLVVSESKKVKEVKEKKSKEKKGKKDTEESDFLKGADFIDGN